MHFGRERFAPLAGMALAAVALNACHPASRSPADTRAATLRVGFGQVSSEGFGALARNLAVENLARLGDDGRPQPVLALNWTASPDGRVLTVTLRPNVKFHDGSPLTADIVAAALTVTLPNAMGPAASDLESVTALGSQQVVIRLRRPTPFLLDSLEAGVPKPGSPLMGTGPFAVSDPNSPGELRASADYYGGRPEIDRVVMQSFPSVRAAWAEMLRNRLDMLYEVGTDALDSLETSKQITVFTFIRRYQYVIVLNPKTETLRSPGVRRALNVAIDRDALIRDALNGHGVASNGLVWLHHYALGKNSPTFQFDLRSAAAALDRSSASAPAHKLRFTCLVPADPVAERIALVVQRQLNDVGIEMAVEQASMDQIMAAIRTQRFEAAFAQVISGPSLLRPYQMWHSKGFFNMNNPAIDTALDRVRYADSDDAYRGAVTSFQQAMVDDPPAIFLAWIEQARAVSKRFVVPQAEAGRDILSTLRLWKPADNKRQSSQN